MTGYYDVAQICLNGHVITDIAHRAPQPDVICLSGSSPKAPAFCHNCGKSYPWTQAKLAAA